LNHLTLPVGTLDPSSLAAWSGTRAGGTTAAWWPHADRLVPTEFPP
jgi:hypothetical protein